MADSRTKNTGRNIATGLAYKFVSIIMPFVNRTAIIYILGAEFAGLSGLFTSILGVLNLAELGFNSAIVYSLYKPLKEKNAKDICYYLTLLRKVYHVVGIVVTGVGLIIMPFLGRLISGGYPDSINLYLLYLLYLINSSISYYLFAYKECLLIADQRQDVSNNIRTWVNIIRYLLQFIILLLTRNFYLYVIVQIAGTIYSNLMIQKITVRKYPEYMCKSNQKIEFPIELKKRVGALMISRICDTFRNSFDNMIIAAMIGLVATTIYGNYYYIFSALYGVLSVICNAMSASVGNSIVANSVDRNYNDMLKFQFLFSWINCWTVVCLLCLYQPFMNLWVGKDMLLPERDMCLFCLYFYLINMNNIRNQYISGTGMWWELKGSYLVETFSNLILNIVLGKILGITGVLLATIITIFFLNFVWRSIVLFRNYFKKESQVRFFGENAEYFIVTLVAAISTMMITYEIHDNGMVGFVLRMGICIIVPNLIYMGCFCWTKRYKIAKQFVVNVAKQLRK